MLFICFLVANVNFKDLKLDFNLFIGIILFLSFTLGGIELLFNGVEERK